MPIPNSDIQCVSFCPNCGNVAPQRLLFVHSYESVGYDTSSGKPSEIGPPCTYFLASCSTCDDLLLYHSFLDEVDSNHFVHASLVYPSKVELDDSVPQAVRSPYEEASRISTVAPNAFAVMLRRALEAICVDRGVVQGSLHARLQELVRQGELPATLAEMSSILRTLGNVGAHATEQSITIPMTWGMNEFFRAVVEYVYVAPSKIKKFKDQMDKRRQSLESPESSD